MDPRIVRVGQDRFDEIVDVLCEAFRDYPVMRFVLRDAAQAYDERLRPLVAYLTDVRVCRGWPVLGLAERGQLVGAANVSPPRPEPAPPALEQRLLRLARELGPAAMARFDAFAEACQQLQPGEPHYYLGMIGVRGRCRGRGYARPLLEAVHEMSGEDPDSAGVALSTETARNVSLYEHFGYRVVGQTDIEDLRTWTMFRPDSA